MEINNINEKIYELRDKGYKYIEIKEILLKDGVNISISKIQVVCKKMYEELGKEEPTHVTDEVIYNLRKQGLTYQEITEELVKQGKQITISTVALRTKKIYKEKNEKVPKGSSIKISDEEIFSLREKRLSYEAICEHFEKKGITVSISFILKRCKQIYAEKGLKEPKSSYSNSRTLDDFDKEILRLREEEGLSYKDIAKAFPEKQITRQGICRRYQKIEKYNNKQMSKMILDLMITKKATLEQIKIIADYYGVNLEKTFDSIEER